MSTKRQQTMAKMARERTVREKRARKLEKKHAAAEERKARAAGLPYGAAAVGPLGDGAATDPHPEPDEPGTTPLSAGHARSADESPAPPPGTAI